MKTKIPTGYSAPLKSRAAITAWLLDRAASNPRKGYGLFCYDVKLNCLNTDFSHLCELAKQSGELPADASARYLAAVKAVYDEKSESVFDMARQAAAESVTENDTNRMLWDESGPCADWEFAGRSGGWLVLTEFDGVKFADAINASCMSQTDWAAEFFAQQSYKYVRRLYRFLIQCDHDFKRPESEVEYQAAFYLFAMFAEDVETDKQAAEREAGERKEQAEAAHWAARDSMTTT